MCITSETIMVAKGQGNSDRAELCAHHWLGEVNPNSQEIGALLLEAK